MTVAGASSAPAVRSEVHRRAESHRHDAGRRGPAHDPWHVDRHDAALVHVQVASLPGSRPAGRLGLHPHLERERQHVRPAPGGRRLQDPLAGDGVQRRRPGDLDVEPDERRRLGLAGELSPPTISGTASVGNQLTANRGSWVGEQPITYSFRWLRCAKDGTNCSEIDGATDNQYQVVDRRFRPRAARPGRPRGTTAGTRSAVSDFRVVSSEGTTPPPPSGGQAVSVSTVPKGERLIVSQVQFSPNPVRSRTAPISIRVLVKDSRGLLIRGAVVFMRATPRVTSGTRTATDGTGWASFQLVPNANFPQPRSGFNVQFFVKAYRQGDPPLGGIAGYRLVQVRLAQ